MRSGFEFVSYKQKQKINGKSDIIYRVTGKERTGTNYIHSMIKNNFEDVNFYIYKFGGKHALPPRHKMYKNPKILKEIENRTFICVLTIKNPYMWANSIGGWKPAYKAYRIDNWFPKQHMINYNNFYYSYKKLLEGGCEGCSFDDIILVRYEDMLENEERELNRISLKFKTPCENNLRSPEKVPFSKSFSKEKRQYYLEQRPPYGRRVIKKVNEFLNWDIMRFYGYEKIEV